jgi:hypothetical protein
MIKFFLRIFYLVLILITSAIIFLSYFGVKTDKFDTLIKNKANTINPYVKLEFKKTNIYLNLKELNLNVKLQNPKILIKNNEINLSKLDLFLSLKSYFSSDFLLKRAEVAFVKNDIKDLTKITNIFLPKFINKRLSKIFRKGIIEGEFIIPFEVDGTIGEDYIFKGKISKATIKLTNQFSIKNLTTTINHLKNIDEDVIEFTILNGNIYDFQLANSKINLNNKKGETKIDSTLHTSGKFNFSQLKKISSLFGLSIMNFNDINGLANLKTNINFKLNNKFRIKNLSYSMEGNINNFEIHSKEIKIIKKYLPEYENKINLKDTNVKLINTKSERTLDLEGYIKVKNEYDSFKIKEIYNYNKKNSNIDGLLDLTNSKVVFDRLNYYKKKGEKSEISFDFNYGKLFNIKKIIFLANETEVKLNNIVLNKKFELKDFKKIKIKTYNNKINNNDFLVQKSKKIKILGDVFDAEPLLLSLFKKNSKKNFSKEFSSEIKINIKKTLTGTGDDVSNFSMIGNIKNGSFNKLSLKGNFSESERIEMSIYQINNDKKTFQLISDRAKPFVKSFNFIKGFEGGKLEYESIISKKVSNSNLIITDFKVSKVPALAKLLTLASLQGIADTLSGDGIRFETFEMKSNSVENILNIEDILAMGPAVSILMEGYVDKGKTVSLRGTLVPATKLNSIIASIPVVGEILVGKKIGEGVVGVSFKMKGPPKNIKTTVNPIKTLTPRFIVRAVEKMKKKKKGETK